MRDDSPKKKSRKRHAMVVDFVARTLPQYDVLTLLLRVKDGDA